MKPRGKMWIAGTCLALLSLLAICDTAAARPPARGLRIKAGPPAHAPAHGYRRQQIRGFDLVFDVGLGVYVAVGVTDVYYHGGYFYRFHGGVWQISLRGVTWEPAGIDKLPSGLQIKAKSMIKLNGNGNSLVKLNGNGPNGNAGKTNGAANANINKPTANPDANGKKSDVTWDNKADSTANANTSKPAGGADANAGKPAASPGGNTAKPGSVSKPSGTAGSSANKPAPKPGASRQAKPAGKGKRK